MFRVVVTLALVAVASAALADAATKKVSAAVKDTTVNGLEGVNLLLSAPFKVDDYQVGFRYNIAKLGEAPETVFARRDFAVADGTVTVQADLNLKDNQVGVAAEWTNGEYTVNAEGNTKDRLTNVGAGAKLDLGGRRVDVNANYALESKVVSAKASVAVDDATATVTYDTDSEEAVITVEKPLDDQNSVIPSVNAKSGAINVGWLRKWTGGSLKTTFHPDDKVVLEWKDNGVNGVWTTTADVPLNNQANSKISFSRDWNY